MRPRFHFTSDGWINDPHAFTFHGGRYHAFFQALPGSAEWAVGCAWGHAVGPDLLSLTEVAPALAAGDGDDGIWTGCLVVDDDGGVRILYTSVSEPDLQSGKIRVATPVDDDWITWRKGEVVAAAPGALAVLEHRDPAVYRDGDVWRMLVGGAGPGGQAFALGYRSADLESWEYEGVALARASSDTDPVWTGDGWECPQLVELDGRHVMVFSVWQPHTLHYAAYAVGTYRDGVFLPDAWGRLTYGPSLYAPTCFADADGRPSVTFWLRGVAGDGWTGAHSIPYLLRLAGDTLIADPHPDVERYAVPAPTAPAFLFEWACLPGDVVTLSAGAEELGTLRADDDEIVVHTRGDAWRMPRAGVVRGIVDGPVLELSNDAGVGAAALPATTAGITITGPVTVRGLARQEP